jgi:hypothetical protein
MTTQAIIRESRTTSFTFAGVPSEATRARLKADGFQFDGKSGQWFRSHHEARVVDEETAAEAIAA